MSKYLLQFVGAALLIFLSNISYSQVDYEQWFFRNEVVSEITDKEFNSFYIEEVSEISNPRKFLDGMAGIVKLKVKLNLEIRSVVLLAVESKGYKMDSLNLAYSKLTKEEAIDQTKGIVHSWISICQEKFGSENVSYDEATFFADKDNSALSISNIPAEGIFFRKLEESSYNVFVFPETLPASLRNEELTNERWKPIADFFFNYFMTSSFDDLNREFEGMKEGTFYSPERFSDRFKEEGKLLSTKNLKKAVEGYVSSLNSGNSVLELQWTHPASAKAYISIKRRQAEEDNDEFSITGPLGSAFEVSGISNISAISELEGIKYAQITLEGTLIYDFSYLRSMDLNDIDPWINSMMLGNSSTYGKENVSYDAVTMSIVTLNREVKLYAIEDPELEGWKFSSQALIDPDQSAPTLSSFSFPIQTTSLFAELLDKMQDSTTYQIIPPSILGNWANDNLSANKKAILYACQQFLESDPELKIGDENLFTGKIEVDQLHDVILYKDRVYGFLTLKRDNQILKCDGSPYLLSIKNLLGTENWKYISDPEDRDQNIFIGSYNYLFLESEKVKE